MLTLLSQLLRHLSPKVLLSLCPSSLFFFFFLLFPSFLSLPFFTPFPLFTFLFLSFLLIFSAQKAENENL